MSSRSMFSATSHAPRLPAAPPHLLHSMYTRVKQEQEAPALAAAAAAAATPAMRTLLQPSADELLEMLEPVYEPPHAWQSPQLPSNTPSSMHRRTPLGEITSPGLNSEYAPSLNPDELQGEWVRPHSPDSEIVRAVHRNRGRVFSMEDDQEEIKEHDEEAPPSPTTNIPGSMLRRMVESIPDSPTDDEARDILVSLDRQLRMLISVAESRRRN